MASAFLSTFRVSGDSLWKNLKRAVGESWQIGFLVRQVLIRQARTDFAPAKTLLRNSELIALVYFTLGGRERSQCAVDFITRDRDKDVRCLGLGDADGHALRYQ